MGENLNVAKTALLLKKVFGSVFKNTLLADATIKKIPSRRNPRKYILNRRVFGEFILIRRASRQNKN